MCSSPKGSPKSHRTRAKNLHAKMDYADYSAMVKRSNDSYEKRQNELANKREQKDLSSEVNSKLNQSTKPVVEHTSQPRVKLLGVVAQT